MKTTTTEDTEAWAAVQVSRWRETHGLHVVDTREPILLQCTADACDQGRKPCPCPTACRVAESQRRDDINAGIWAWCCVSAVLLAAIIALAA